MRDLAAIVGVLSILAASPAWGYELKRDPDGTPVRWPSEEITFWLPARIPDGLDADEVRAAVTAAVESWAQAAGVRVRLELGDASAAPGYQTDGANHNDILFIEHDWPYDANAVGVALLTTDPRMHSIVDADVVLNAAQHRFRALPKGNRGGIYDDLQSALAHELGHALGLEHSSVEGAVMYPHSERGDTSKQRLADDDVEGARALYSGQAEAVAAASQALGCSSASGAAAPWLFALAAGAMLVRRRARRTALAGKARA